MNPPYNTNYVHREACDECHSRKVRCISDGKACQNCITTRQRCIFSPRNPPGRPQKRAKSTTNGLPMRVPSPTSGGAQALSSTSTSASWQRQPPTPSPPSLDSSFGFFGGNVSATNNTLTPAASVANLQDPASQHDAKDTFFFDMDFATTYTISEEVPMLRYHSASESQTRSGGTSQNGSESDSRSQGEDQAFKKNQTQLEDQMQTQSRRPSEFDVDPSPTPTYNFMYTFTQLSKFLFDLRRDRNSLLQEQTPMAVQTALSPLQQVFQRVSTFIDLSKTATNHLDLMMSQGATSEIQSLTHLSLMIISITVDIYLSLAHAGIFSENMSSSASAEMTYAVDNTGNSNTWVSANAPQQADYISSSIQPSNFPPLTVVLNLTIMDFHMAQFQGIILQMFSHLLAVDQGASEELQKTQAQTSQVRARLQLLISSVMSAEGP